MGIGPAFDVDNDQLVVTAAPDIVTAGRGFGLVVEAENGKGKVDTTFSGSVTLADLCGRPLADNDGQWRSRAWPPSPA